MLNVAGLTCACGQTPLFVEHGSEVQQPMNCVALPWQMYMSPPLGQARLKVSMGLSDIFVWFLCGSETSNTGGEVWFSSGVILCNQVVVKFKFEEAIIVLKRWMSFDSR